MIEKEFNSVKAAWEYMTKGNKGPNKYFSIPVDRPFVVIERSKEEQFPKPEPKRDRSNERNYKVHWADIPEYISPVTRRPVDGRAARREDMKRSGCREVDPSEGLKDGFVNKRFCEKHGLQHNGG